MATTSALAGVRVLDLSTLLPGPMATRFLADAGADVVRIERPSGDDLRSVGPFIGGLGATYTGLNAGKRAFAADLKVPDERDLVLGLARDCDVLIEQFRPGVADRLGLGQRAVAAINPRVVYCSISGYGQTGPLAGAAGHDLNYLAAAGVLGMGAHPVTGDPQMPLAPLADLVSGAQSAVINILLALRARDESGTGCHLDVSMTHGLSLLSYERRMAFVATGIWPEGAGQFGGRIPRYNLFRTQDDRFLAVAAYEPKFWSRFCALLDIDQEPPLTDRPTATALVAERIRGQTAAHWKQVFDGEDACVSLVATLEEAERAGLVPTVRKQDQDGRPIEVFSTGVVEAGQDEDGRGLRLSAVAEAAWHPAGR